MCEIEDFVYIYMCYHVWSQTPVSDVRQRQRKLKSSSVSQFFFFCLSIPFIIFALPFSLLPSRNSGPGPQSRLFSLHPHYGACLAFYREKISALSSLVNFRRIVLTHAIICALDSWCHLRIKISIRGESNPRPPTLTGFVATC